MESEYRKAEAKHPFWPDNRLEQVCILVEEAGESLQATMNFLQFVNSPPDFPTYEDMDELREKIRIEVAQTGAMALRLLQEF